MNTPEVCARSGATFRQLDYWSHIGVFRDSSFGKGSGSQRVWDESQAVTARALVLLSQLPIHSYSRFAGLEQMIRTAMSEDPDLTDYAITVHPEKVEVSTRVRIKDVGLIVRLAACLRYVRKSGEVAV